MTKLKAFTPPVVKFTSDQRCRLGSKARQSLDDNGHCFAVFEYRDGVGTPVSLHHSIDAATKKKREEHRIMEGEVMTLECLKSLGLNCPHNMEAEYKVVMVKRDHSSGGDS
jgi:hypothetical protein